MCRGSRSIAQGKDAADRLMEALRHHKCPAKGVGSCR